MQVCRHIRRSIQRPLLHAELHLLAESERAAATAGIDVARHKMAVFIYSGLLAGLVANVALILNIIILLGVMCSIGTTLTLPGIAGVVLTIGMAVDANVLIFERIREESAKGKSMRGALSAGYSRAFFKKIEDGSRQSAREVVPLILALTPAASVVDVVDVVVVVEPACTPGPPRAIGSSPWFFVPGPHPLQRFRKPARAIPQRGRI